MRRSRTQAEGRGLAMSVKIYNDFDISQRVAGKTAEAAKEGQT
jgi:hypothetical protein